MTTTTSSTTTTTLPAKKGKGKGAIDPNSPAGFLKAVEGVTGTIGSVPGGTAGAAGTGTPGVTSTDAGDVITFSLPNEPPVFTLPSAAAGDVTGTEATGETITFENWMKVIRSLYLDPEAIKRLASQLRAAGFIKTANYVNNGALDSTILTAWKDFGLSLVGAPKGVSASTVLAMGPQAAGTLNELQKIQADINSARGKAAAITSSNVTLTDPNEVGQRFATAMESMGMGAPTQKQVQQFVQAFINGPQGEIAAERNQVDTEKQNYLSGIAPLTTAFNKLNAGVLSPSAAATLASGAGPGGGVVGPTAVATKAQPNLDAEAIAAAQAINPAEYYANDMTYGYSLLQHMLDGDMSLPSAPSSPTSLTTSGAITTTPIAGAP